MEYIPRIYFYEKQNQKLYPHQWCCRKGGGGYCYPSNCKDRFPKQLQGQDAYDANGRKKLVLVIPELRHKLDSLKREDLILFYQKLPRDYHLTSRYIILQNVNVIFMFLCYRIYMECYK